jgi:hypothetical protein
MGLAAPSADADSESLLNKAWRLTGRARSIPAMTNLLIDINGYFAPSGESGHSLTGGSVPGHRYAAGRQWPAVQRNVESAGEGGRKSLRAAQYLARFRVQCDRRAVWPLYYLTLWPHGENMPVVSTLGAGDGAITSDMAIVPNVDGKTDAYARGATQWILDISSYFAP